MKTLGIDYGRSKVGIAIGVDSFAEPLKVIRYTDVNILADQIKDIINNEDVEKIIVGLSEGAMAEEIKDFVKTIKPSINLPIELYDETLSSKDAQRLSREAGIGQKKRREMEDAYAAAIMLQNYLDFSE